MRFVSAARRYVRELLDALPADARVDPALFTEAEYPVFCMQCGYELRGLHATRCPECGREFDRGQLLVDQYVRCQRPRTDRRRRAARRLVWIARAIVAVFGLTMLLFGLLVRIAQESVSEFLVSLPLYWMRVFVRVFFGLLVLAFVCGVSGAVLWAVTLPPKSKRRKVRSAVPKR